MNNKEVAKIVDYYGFYTAIKHVLDGNNFHDYDLKIQWQYCQVLINNIEKLLQSDNEIIKQNKQQNCIDAKEIT